MSSDVRDAARRRLSALTAPADMPDGDAAAVRLAEDSALIGRFLAAVGTGADGEDVADGAGGSGRAAVEDNGAALSLLEGMRAALDEVEAQVVMEARRRGLDWRQIARHRGLNSSQAASQRHQRLVTRLEEIRQGVR
ncbi:hypothetical protein [Streptomyces fragilis]|uniref:DNA-binding protein n=1 Tax=Streptomyces fragilis TaxID=67301 RepID=A0ABV2YK46_9ACTN|nr:hypothetical protein [Streptomyces fragilis]